MRVGEVDFHVQQVAEPLPAGKFTAVVERDAEPQAAGTFLQASADLAHHQLGCLVGNEDQFGVARLSLDQADEGCAVMAAAADQVPFPIAAAATLVDDRGSLFELRAGAFFLLAAAFIRLIATQQLLHGQPSFPLGPVAVDLARLILPLHRRLEAIGPFLRNITVEETQAAEIQSL